MTAKLTQVQVQERIQELFNTHGITLVSEFTKARDTHTFRCSNGHEWPATWYNVYNHGNGCPVCAGLKIDDIEERIQKLFNTRGITLISEFTKTNDKHTFKCSNGHEWPATWYSVYNNGNGCPVCAGIATGERLKLNSDIVQERIQELFNTHGITLVSEFTKARDTHTFRCSNGHEWPATWYNVYNNGSGCPVCNPQYSKGEKAMSAAIARICRELNLPEPQENVRGAIGGRLEIDCYIPSLSLGFEYDGTYWHGFDDAQERDARKNRNAEYYGIQLIRVQESEWTRDPESVINNIENAIRARLLLPPKPSRWKFTSFTTQLQNFATESLPLF